MKCAMEASCKTHLTRLEAFDCVSNALGLNLGLIYAQLKFNLYTDVY